MKTEITVRRGLDYIDVYFEVAISGDWAGTIWRFQTTYDRDEKTAYLGEWALSLPGQGFEDSADEPPHEVLQVYEERQGEVIARLIFERMQG